MKKIKKSTFRKASDYFLLFMLIAISGIPFFSGGDITFIVLLFISSFIFLTRKPVFDVNFFLLVALFIIIELLQVFIHGGFDYWTFFGTYVKLFMVYFISKILFRNFPKYFVNILYFLTFISLIFYSFSFIPGFSEYFIHNICPYFESPFKSTISFYSKSPSIIIFSFEGTLLTDHRNSGPFWEPGAFAVFLNVALLFNLTITKKLSNWKNILFVVAIVTTFSTAGFIALATVLGGYFTIKRGLLNKVMVAILVLLSSYLFTRLDFLQKKITHNIEIAEQTTSSRFGSALADYKLFIQSPIVGWGRGDARYGSQSSKFTGSDHRNNGIFILLASYGIIITLVYFYSIYKSFNVLAKQNNISSWFSYVSLLVILILGFSQGIFSLPFFYAFLFLYLNYKKPVLHFKKNLYYKYRLNIQKVNLR